jgi:hypothetical protein
VVELCSCGGGRDQVILESLYSYEKKADTTDEPDDGHDKRSGNFLTVNNKDQKWSQE